MVPRTLAVQSKCEDARRAEVNAGAEGVRAGGGDCTRLEGLRACRVTRQLRGGSRRDTAPREAKASGGSLSLIFELR